MMEDSRSSDEHRTDIATKSDLRRLESRMATKLDQFEKSIRSDMATGLERVEKSIRSDMATKEDLERVEKSIRSDMATKEDLERVEKSIRSDMATKEDLNRVEKNIRSDMATKDMFYRVDSQLKQLRDDIAPIKDSHTMGSAIREADLIAEEMGFRYARTLKRKDIRDLVNGKGLPEASPDDAKSFRRADLIMEVTDSLGEVAYICVEVSFMADRRDVDRAARNARYMRELTGKQSKAAIVGLRRDNRIRNIPQSEVFWYNLPQSALHSE